MRKKPTFYPNLYIGESISTKNLDKLKRNLIKKPLFANVYVITISKNPYNQLEIYDAKQLAQRYYRKYPPYIVGIAGDYEEALLLVQQIVQECLQDRSDCSLKEYLLC